MEQLTLSSLAQTLMDMYYRDFQADGEFFDIDIFTTIARAVYGKLLDVEAKEWRRVEKQENGYYTIAANPEWQVSETIELKKEDGKKNMFSAQLKDLPFAFSFDKWGYGIQSIIPEEDLKLERTTADKIWELKHMPITQNVYWYSVQNKIIAFSKCEKLGKMDVYYVPSLTGAKADEAYVPIAKQGDILTIGFQVMINAKNGIVDKSNNGNPNSVIQTEVDNVFTGIKTKPA